MADALGEEGLLLLRRRLSRRYGDRDRHFALLQNTEELRR